MTDWKEEVIVEYHTLQEQRAVVAHAQADDIELKNARLAMEKAIAMFSALEEVYNDKIGEINAEIEVVRTTLQTKWDITEKTFDCNAGRATIRTTKSIVITDKGGLLDRLTELFGDRRKAYACIRTFDLPAIRKYMDVDLIAGHIAHYDEKKNVIIKDAEKGDGKQ